MITSKAVVVTSLGTGETKTQLAGADVSVPSWAKMLLAVKVTMFPLTPKANLGYYGKFYLESEDVPNLTPYIGLAPPVGGIDATTGNTFVPPKAEYIVNCPVTGGEGLKLYGEMFLGDATAASYMGMDLIFGSKGAKLPAYRDPLGGIQRHCKLGTWTAAVDGKATGTAYSVLGAKRIVEVLGLVGTLAAADSKPAAGEFELLSSGFRVNPVSWNVQPVGAVLGATDSSHVACISRMKDLDIPIAPITNIVDTYNQAAGVAITTDKWVTGVVYI